MQPLILFPFNGNAKEALAVVRAANAVCPSWDILGFVDDDPAKKGLAFDGATVLGGREAIAAHPEAMVLAVPGRPENFKNRPDIIAALGLPRERLATLVHPSAAIGPQCRIGANCLIMAGVVLTAGVSLGDHVAVLPNTVISHDATVGDFTLIGSGVCVSGGVRIGRNCYIGTGSRFIQEIEVGDRSLVGLGSVVIRDVAQDQTVAGCPAKPVARRGA